MHATPMHPSARATLAYTGTLLHAAQARTTVIDHDGHTVPVLCMDIELDNAEHTHMHVEQAYPRDHYTQCEAAARRYKRGDRVEVGAPLTAQALVVRYASHITALPAAVPDVAEPVTAELFS